MSVFAFEFKAILEKHDAAAVLVGWPQERTENSSICAFIRYFVKDLQQTYEVALPICRINESFTTVRAKSVLYNLSLKRTRNLVNQTAAAAIMERFQAEMSETLQAYED